MSDARKRAVEALAIEGQCGCRKIRCPHVLAALDALRALLDETAEPAPAAAAPRVRLSACAWCGGSLVQDPDATHRWRCINAEQRKCVARGDWYILDDDRDYIPVYPAPAPSDAVREAAEALRLAVREAEPITRDDAMTLIGHAEYLSRVHGEEDMPRFFRGLANRILAALAARIARGREDDATLRAAAREALTVLTRLADSAAYWSDYDVPVGIVADVDAAKARLAGVLNG